MFLRVMVAPRRSSYKADIVLFWVIFERTKTDRGEQVDQYYLSRSFREPGQGFIVGCVEYRVMMSEVG